jgi:hypothetical protein
MVKGITHIELETTRDFFDIFVEGCQLTRMPDVLPRVAPAVEADPGAVNV